MSPEVTPLALGTVASLIAMVVLHRIFRSRANSDANVERSHGTGSNASPIGSSSIDDFDAENEGLERFAEARDRVPSAVASLINQAKKYYPNRDPERALALFLKAVALCPEAPANGDLNSDIDLSDVGFAVRAAWVCMEVIEHQEAEIQAYLAQAERISPITVHEIRQQIGNHGSEAARTAEHSELMADFERLLESASAQELQEASKDVIASARGQGAWWELRDLAISIPRDKHGDLAWSLLNAALQVAMTKNGNLPSIYVAMGDLLKAEAKHADAAKQYLLACATASEAPLKRAVDQVRISLQKAGLTMLEAAKARDELLLLCAEIRPAHLARRIDTYLE